MGHISTQEQIVWTDINFVKTLIETCTPNN